MDTLKNADARRGQLRLTAAAVIATLAALCLGAAEAQALKCGKYVTRDVKLKKNMSCPGLAIGTRTDDITIDLNGHRIAGPGRTGKSIAIRVDDAEGVTVKAGKGGRIVHYGAGIVVDYGTTGTKVKRVKLRNIQIGAMIFDDAARIIGLDIKGAVSQGIRLDDGNDVLLRGNRVRFSGGNGITVSADAGSTTLKANRTHRNDGSGLDIDSAFPRVGKNRSNFNGDWGIFAPTFAQDLGQNKAKGNAGGNCNGVSC